MGSWNEAKHLISLYKATQRDFKKLLETQIERCHEEDMIPRIFIDIRGMFINVHDKNGKQICTRYKRGNIPAYSRDIILVINNWCKIFQEVGLNPIIVPFGEHGSSEYHLKLEKTYKEGRVKKAMLDCGEALMAESSAYIKDELKNLDWIFSTKGTDVCSLISENLEFDAAVQLVKKNFPEHRYDDPYGAGGTKKYLNIILSKDKDFAQCLDENTFQITKKKDGYKLVSEDNAPFVLMKMKEEHVVPARYMSLALAMIGDASDGYKGIQGCAEGTTGDFLTEFWELLDKIPAKNSFKKFRSLMRYDSESKNFNKVKKLYLRNKRAFFRSYCLADFNTLLEVGKHSKTMQTHIDKYERVIFCEEMSPAELIKKQNYIASKFDKRYQIDSESKYYSIILNTRK